MSVGNSNSLEPAVLAVESFNRGEYSACLRHLGSLPAPADPRVEHNRALAELFSNDTRGGEKYRAVLARLLGVNFPRITDLPAAALKRPTFVYNYVVLLYHARHYRQAAEVLHRLMDEQIDDVELKRRIALLFAEICLCRRTARRSLEVAKTVKRILDKDSPEDHALVARLACRARLMLGERVDVHSAGVTDNSIEGLILSAHACFLKGDMKGAAETLAQHSSLQHNYTVRAHGEDVWPALNNNLGVIHLAINKPALAAKYFQMAIKEQERCVSEGGDNRLCTVRDRPLYVYNLGLALLRAGRPAPAFELLVVAARHFPSNPRLWRRLADCCVRHATADSNSAALIRFGSGTHTRLALTTPEKRDYSTQGESFAIPSLSLEFAALCLRNALTLLPAKATEEPLQAPPGAPLDANQRKSLRNAVLILNSYVLLRLQDPLAALNSATELLRSDGASEAQLVLAHLYAAESLMMLDRVPEATEHLNPPVIHELVSALHPAAQDVLGIQVWATAAVCHVLRGDLPTARKILSQLDSPRVVPLQVYLEMSTGNLDACHAILRKMKCVNL